MILCGFIHACFYLYGIRFLFAILEMPFPTAALAPRTLDWAVTWNFRFEKKRTQADTFRGLKSLSAKGSCSSPTIRKIKKVGFREMPIDQNQLLSLWTLEIPPGCDEGMMLAHAFLEAAGECVNNLGAGRTSGNLAALLIAHKTMVQHSDRCRKCNDVSVSRRAIMPTRGDSY